MAATVLATAIVIVYGTEIWIAALGVASLAVVAAFVPRRSARRRLKLSAQRERRRMWPGTGMKVTVDALPSPCFVADGRGITRYANALAMQAYEGVKPGDPLSFSLRAPSLLEAFDRVCATGGTEKITWIEKVPTECWFEAHIAPIYLPGTGKQEHGPSRPDFILVAIHDLTENRRVERMRSDFVANASHELRTPLASLTGFIETLQGPARNDPDAQARFLEIMLDQASRMRRLIDDILSLSRIELKAHIRPEATADLKEVVMHTADAMTPLARDMNMEIKCSVPDQPATVTGDRDELIQVTENLVENALKYGSDGKHVDIVISLDSTEPDRQSWDLAVRDYGDGIAPEHLPRLTERFYRADIESSRAMKGTGLGLAIVKHILNRHRARLEVDSTPGQGSTFKVKFPNTGGKAFEAGKIGGTRAAGAALGGKRLEVSQD
ncbi:ATP-binding protein [Roseibium denhamense]